MKIKILSIILASVISFSIYTTVTDAEPIPKATIEKHEVDHVDGRIDNTVYTYYISASSGTEVYKKESTGSTVLYSIPWGEKVKTCKSNSKKFLGVKIGKTIVGYICKKDICKEKPRCIMYDISSYHLTAKSYSDMRSITATNTPQYKLRMLATVGDYGIMTVNGRYCVALGSHFDCSIGQYFDIILQNGIVIKCIKCDAKADEHTNANNVYTTVSKCATEFYVYTPALYSAAKNTGNLNCVPMFKGQVNHIKVYQKRIKL